MLYDKRWDSKKNANAEVFSLPDIIAWLETKTGEYSFGEPRDCLISQYLQFLGHKNAHCGGWGYAFDWGQKEQAIPSWLNDDIAIRHPRTFEAAASRARKIAESV